LSRPTLKTTKIYSSLHCFLNKNQRETFNQYLKTINCNFEGRLCRFSSSSEKLNRIIFDYDYDSYCTSDRIGLDFCIEEINYEFRDVFRVIGPNNDCEIISIYTGELVIVSEYLNNRLTTWRESNNVTNGKWEIIENQQNLLIINIKNKKTGGFIVPFNNIETKKNKSFFSLFVIPNINPNEWLIGDKTPSIGRSIVRKLFVLIMDNIKYDDF